MRTKKFKKQFRNIWGSNREKLRNAQAEAKKCVSYIKKNVYLIIFVIHIYIDQNIQYSIGTVP